MVLGYPTPSASSTSAASGGERSQHPLMPATRNRIADLILLRQIHPPQQILKPRIVTQAVDPSPPQPYTRLLPN